MRKNFLYFLILFFLFFSASCGKKNTTETPSNDSEARTFDSHVYCDTMLEPFVELLNAYAEFARNELTEENKQLIDHSFFMKWERERMYSSAMPWWRWNTPIMYALYDINGNGAPELFIGAPYGIAGIYTLQDGVPASVAQAGWSNGLDLSVGTCGNYFISRWWGWGMGEIVYSIDENGTLNELINLFIKTDYPWGFNETNPTVRTKEIDGEETIITEEEYAELVIRYGLYGSPHRLENQISPNPVNLEWSLIE
jgi:hypothetical protein